MRVKIFQRVLVATLYSLAICAVMEPSNLSAAEKILVSGDCRDFSFFEKFDYKMGHESGEIARVLRDNAALYSSPTEQSAVSEASFSDVVTVVEIETKDELPDERVKMRFLNDDARSYWIDRTDLHCRRTPLIDKKTQLERKALIRTKTTAREDGVVQAITAFRSPDIKQVVPDDSRKLSRFTTYLIYGEGPDTYLLGDQFNLVHSQHKLIGWVDKKHVLNWNWAIGLRPARDLKNADGSTGSICGYTSLEAGADCVPILGGISWFKSPLRLPVLEVTDSHYRVAAAASGIDANLAENGKIRLTKEMLDRLEINPEGAADSINEDKIRAFNQVDVFFLIDGTKSMGPFIDGIRGTPSTPGVVRTIVSEIEERRNGASIRAGFRVFRDSKKGGQPGIDESYGLRNANCEDETTEIRERERRRFERRLATIRTTSEENDDFDENLLGGLEQAADDMQGCPDRQKLLFVISDAGYNPDMQVRRGHQPLSPEQVARRLTRLEKVTVFFLRPPLRGPSEFKSRSSHEHYAESWNEYRDYAGAILNRVLKRDQSDSGAALSMSDYFFDINPGQRSIESMLDKIVSSIKSVTRPEIVTDILIDLRGGAALEQVITRLQRENEDVPVLYWNMLRRTACEDNEEICNQRIYDGIFDLYVPKSEVPVLDAWMRTDELEDWLSLLRTVMRASLSSSSERRNAFGQTIRNSLSSVLRLPSPTDMDESVQEYMQRGGFLPGPLKTPLLNYTFDDLTNPESIPVCEIDRLLQWLDASQSMLELARNNELSSYEVVESQNCPRLSPQGAHLKMFSGRPTPVAPGPDTRVYRLRHDDLGEQIYWIPHQYLP